MRAVIAALLLCASPAYAQHNHDYGHSVYQSWVNKAGFGCCDGRDCGSLADSDERTDGNKIEVRVEGVWCQVMTNHYLRRGNAPDWSTSHICVGPRLPSSTSNPCDRLRCYQPRPLF